jgi:hypothetical protein
MINNVGLWAPMVFLVAYMAEEVVMCIHGRLAELMVKTAPYIYRKFVSAGTDNKPILYVRLQKALYECMVIAMLFYIKLVKDLELDGLEVNPYDPCVDRKIVNKKQFRVTWHEDDLKLSHVDADKGPLNG